MPAAAPAEPKPRSTPRGSLRPTILAACLGLLIGDALRPAPTQLSARAAVAAIDAYQATLSPALGRSGLAHCRYTPTCSAYGREAIARYGNPKGFALATWRVLRCHPWATPRADPVP